MSEIKRIMGFSKDYFSKDYFFGKKRSNYADYAQWDNDRFWRSIIVAVKKYKISGRMLDIGCAFGFLLKRVDSFFDKIYGIDISDFAIQEAKKQAPSAELKTLDINTEELPYPDNFFDLVTALDILEHTKSIEKSLKKILPKLKDDGYLIISIPLKDTWTGKIFLFFDKDRSHFNVPSRKELFRIIDQRGLKIINKSYFFNMIYLKLRGIPVDIELILQKK